MVFEAKSMSPCKQCIINALHTTCSKYSSCITRISLLTTEYNNVPGVNNIVGGMVYRRLESTCEQRECREMHDAVYRYELNIDIAKRLALRSAVVTSHRSLHPSGIALEETVRRV